jgi:hypothetical protein
VTSFSQALTDLIDARYQSVRAAHDRFPIGTLESRDALAVGDKNIRISYEVFGYGGLLDDFYDTPELLDFGVFDNCREYGLTVTVGGWTFAVYEHRNSDDIILNGCPTDQVLPYGPYAPDGDKHDVLFAARWTQYHEAAQAVAVAARYVLDHPDADRAAVRDAVAAVHVPSS